MTKGNQLETKLETDDRVCFHVLGLLVACAQAEDTQSHRHYPSPLRDPDESWLGIGPMEKAARVLDAVRRKSEK